MRRVTCYLHNMMYNVPYFCIIIIIFLQTIANAIGFNHWQTGITLCLQKRKPEKNVMTSHKKLQKGQMQWTWQAAQRRRFEKMSAVNHRYSKFKDFKDHFQNSRTFQGSSKIAIEIQGLFKDFKDLSEIQGFQGLFQGCGHPVILVMKTRLFKIGDKFNIVVNFSLIGPD